MLVVEMFSDAPRSRSGARSDGTQVTISHFRGHFEADDQQLSEVMVKTRLVLVVTQGCGKIEHLPCGALRLVLARLSG